MCLGKPNTPAVQQLPAEPPPPPNVADPAVAKARGEDRRRAALSAGRDSTILTGAQGLTDTVMGKKTLLGT